MQHGLNKLVFRQAFWTPILGKEKIMPIYSLQIQNGFYHPKFSILEMSKLRPREVKDLAQDHTDDKQVDSGRT